MWAQVQKAANHFYRQTSTFHPIAGRVFADGAAALSRDSLEHHKAISLASLSFSFPFPRLALDAGMQALAEMPLWLFNLQNCLLEDGVAARMLSTHVLSRMALYDCKLLAFDY
jgi:hypothetical protein